MLIDLLVTSCCLRFVTKYILFLMHLKKYLSKTFFAEYVLVKNFLLFLHKKEIFKCFLTSKTLVNTKKTCYQLFLLYNNHIVLELKSEFKKQ